MERICESRAADGLPALAVQWGAIGDVGLVADMQEDNKELVIGGTLQQRISSCLQVLDNFLRQKAPIVSSMVVAEKRAGMDNTLSVVERVLEIMGNVCHPHLCLFYKKESLFIIKAGGGQCDFHWLHFIGDISLP
jgi:fatty acid synthase